MVGVSEELRKDRFQVMEVLWREYTNEERKWRVKSRVQWLKEGDRNTRYFHRVSKAKSVKRNMVHLNYDGRSLENPKEIKEAVRDHFVQFFASDNRDKPRLRNLGMQTVSMEMNLLLEEEFSEAEIQDAIWGCDGNKAPGPDGFTMAYFTEFWDVIKADLFNFFPGILPVREVCERFEYIVCFFDS